MKRKKIVVTTTTPSQNARRECALKVHTENGKYMSVYHRNNLTNHLAGMATFQRLKCHQRSQCSSRIREEE